MARPEQWMLCCDWLRRVGLIGLDHLLATPQAKLTDLCIFLRDGVMLCKLLYLLDKHSIDLRSINQRPQKAQFLCLKNIGIFLQTCEQKFDLDKDDLFMPQMLFESSDFKKVLQTLSKLSNCPKAQRLHIAGFPEERNVDDDDIYETLERDMANQSVETPSTPTIASNGEEGFNCITELSPLSVLPQRLRSSDEAVYESLCYVTLKPKEVEAPDFSRKRDLCLQEIVETENNYVIALNMLCTKFLEPLKKVLFEEQIKNIFGCIPELAKVHQVLHRDLRDAQNGGSEKTISEVFLEHQERLIVYGEYCANLVTARQELEDVMSNNDEAKSIIQEAQDEVNDGRHQLQGYLMVPLQRILKYHLLLQELVRHTQAQPHSDLGDLKRAHEAMKDLADYINEVKRDKEMLQIIRDLRNSIMEMPSDINDWQDLGKLRHDGETKIECHPEQIKKRYVFVFDKVMVICSKQTRIMERLLGDEKYFFKDLVKLENCRVDNSGGSGTGSNSRGRQNSFFLVVGHDKKAYTITTKDSDSKEKWMKCISDAIEYLNPSKNREMGHGFAITTFSRPSIRCMMCNKLLKGTIFQGYKCSKCELVVHRSCLNGVQLCEGRARHESPIPANQTQVIWKSNDVYPGYGNLHLQQYAWWVGKMTREKSTEVLDHLPEGTFLIRWSDRNQKLVLSLRYGYEVKHMRIMKQEETSSFYLSEVRYFRTLEGLVSYYRDKSLSECFSDLYANLTHPLYEVAIANHSYRGTGSNHLSLNPGDRVIVISHDGENSGWWKGRIENREGYFPKNFVTVQDSYVQN